MSIYNIYIDDTGLHRDRLPDILENLQAKVRTIYGSDVILDEATPDGQLLAAFAEALDDTAQAVEDTYNGRNPDVATGQNLTATCRINEVNRIVGDYAYVDVQMTIAAGAVIPAGTQVQDEDTGAIYASTVAATGSMPAGGVQTVTCKAVAKGSVSAAGKITKIVRPTYGLSVVTNAAQSTIVDAEETDEQLRLRRNQSTATHTAGYADSILAKLLTVPGVGKVKVWENDQGVPADIKSGDQALPAHSVAVIVTGGGASDIGTALITTKPPGIPTAGASTVQINDSQGLPHVLRYTVASPVEYALQITYRAIPGAGFGAPGTGGEEAVKAALVAWSAASQQPSADVYRYHLAAIAQQAVLGSDGRPTMVIADVQVGRTAGTLAAADLALDWDEIGSLLAENIEMVAL